MSERRLLVTARRRGLSRLDDFAEEPPPDPSIEALVAATGRPLAGEPLWLTGGEPTLRGDLPQLIEALAAAGHTVGLITDGLPLAKAGAVAPLIGAGLARARVTLHAPRADAHDFFVERPGAAKLAVRAIGRIKAGGVGVELGATVTRSTQTLLSELVQLAASVGASAVTLRRLTLRGRAEAEAIMLSPRLALLEPYLLAAVAEGARRSVAVRLEGFPACAMRGADAARISTDWLVVPGDAWLAVRDALAPPAARGACPNCPGAPRCAGAPADYVARFGFAEFRSELGAAPVPAQGGAPSGVPMPPPPRAGRAPATRLARVRALAGRPIGGDPIALPVTAPPPKVIRVRFAAPPRVACAVCAGDEVGLEPESTRRVRLRLVRAAQEGASVLRVASAGSLAHPAAAALLRETTLLGFHRVEIAGEASALADFSDAELFVLKGITRLDVALYGPDAAQHDAHTGRAGSFAAALTGARRLSQLAGVEVGSYAVLHDAGEVRAYAAAWRSGALLGEPCFRLSPRGAALSACADALAALDPPAATALARVLPGCLQGRGTDALEGGVTFEDGLDFAAQPNPSDRCGSFRSCTCSSPPPGCVGWAEGWAGEPAA